MKRYYDILGLSPSASPRKIREQYRKLAKTYHPDRLTDPAQKAEYEDKLKEINEAYEALSEIVKRANLTPQERKLDFLYRRGQELLEQRKYAQAMVVLTEILAINAAYRDARSLLQETRRKHKHVAALYAKADDFYRQKKWAEAALAFEEVLKADSNYRDAAKKLKKVRREQLMSDFMKQY